MRASLAAFARLFDTPVTLMGLLPLVWVIVWPISFVESKFGNTADLFSDPVLILVLWAETAAVMAWLGVLVTGWVASAHTPLFAFSVPQLRHRVLAGKRITGLAVSLVAGGVVGYLSGWANGITLAASAYAFFAVGGMLTDSALPLWAKLPAASVIATVMLKPWLIQPVLSSLPAATVILAGVVAFVISRFERSTEAARRRAHRQQDAAAFQSTPFFKLLVPRRSADESVFKGLPRTGHFWDWVTASNYESFGMAKHGRLRVFAFLGAIFGFLGHVLGNASFGPSMVLLGASNASFGLIGRPYPISRQRKADVLFARAVLDSLSVLLCLFLMGLLLTTFGFPAWDSGTGLRRHDPLVLWFLVVLAWMPLVQWPSVTSPWPTAKRYESRKWMAWMFVRSTVAIVLINETWDMVAGAADGRPAVVVAAGFSVALASHVVYWRLLRRHFAKADLI